MSAAIQIVMLQQIKRNMIVGGKETASIEEYRLNPQDVSGIVEEKEVIEGISETTKFTRIMLRSDKPDVIVIGSPAVIEAKIVSPNRRKILKG